MFDIEYEKINKTITSSINYIVNECFNVIPILFNPNQFIIIYPKKKPTNPNNALEAPIFTASGS